MTEAKIIKKYPNRSLYDTSRSEYISLLNLKQYVLQDIAFEVQDAKSKKDITRKVLLQIIADEENSGTQLFSTDVLRRFIRIYGDNIQGFFSGCVEKMSNLLDQQTRQFWEQSAENPDFNPETVMTESTKQNRDN